MNTAYPKISVIIPTYNEEKNLPLCLNSIKKQMYDQKKIEILIVDDYSTDKTKKIAKKFGARVIMSGFKHIERSKSIGLEKAKGDFVLLVDADIVLVEKDWLKKSIDALEANKNACGAQAIYWAYSKNHTIYNRYCELLGVNDPFVYMLKKRGVLGPFEDSWIYPSTIIKTKRNYFITQFTKENLPTLGSQGYLAKRDYILKYTNWKPYFFHLDTIYELVAKNHNIFLLMKLHVEHNYVDSFFNFYKKLYRNIMLFLQYRNLRKYDYNSSSFQFYLTIVIMMSVIYPFAQSIQGYIKKPDSAWFLHPVFCFTVPLLYTYAVIKWRVFYNEKNKIV